MYPLTITEIDGTNFLVLSDSALPEQRSMSLSTKLRRKSTYYPGNSVPSTQIMGTQEEPITLKGKWRDDLLGAIDGAQDLAAKARALVAGQRRCRLEWDNVVRYGYVDAFDAVVIRRNSLEWTLTFFADQSDDAVILAVPALPLVTPFSLANALAGALEVADELATLAISANNIVQAVA